MIFNKEEIIFLIFFLCYFSFFSILYFNFFQIFKSLELFIEFFESSTIILFSFRNFQISFHFTDFIGSSLALQSYRSLKLKNKSSIEILFCCCLMQFGGTTLTALLLGQPPGWLLSHSSLVSLLFAWWLIFHSPSDIYWNLIHLTPLTRKIWEVVFTFFLYISFSHAITSWGMDKVLYNTFHLPTHTIRESMILALLCSVLSSNGGGLICNFLSLFSQNSFQIHTPTCLQNTEEGEKTRSNLICSLLLGLIYYIIVNPLQFFPWESLTPPQRFLGHSVVGYLAIFLWLQSHLSSNCNITGKIVNLFLTILGITSKDPKEKSSQTEQLENKSKSENSNNNNNNNNTNQSSKKKSNKKD